MPDQALAPNLHSEAIEMVCGGSSIGCVIVERKAQYRGKWEKQQHRTSMDQLEVQHECTVKGGMNGNTPAVQAAGAVPSQCNFTTRQNLAGLVKFHKF